MQESTLMQEGLTLMAFGMGFVFVFLSVLVVATTLMSKTVGRLMPEPAKSQPPRRSAAAGKQEDEELTVVIGAAVHRYRRRHGARIS